MRECEWRITGESRKGPDYSVETQALGEQPHHGSLWKTQLQALVPEEAAQWASRMGLTRLSSPTAAAGGSQGFLSLSRSAL